MNEQQTKWENLKEKMKNYKKPSADKLTKKKLFSDMVNTFICIYKGKQTST